MRYSTKDIAEYIVTKCVREQEPITNLYLQKILYFIQRNYINSFGEVLFADEFEAWKFGPVIPSVYYKFSTYGSQPITKDFGRVIEDDSVIAFIDPIIETKRKLDPWDFVDDILRFDGAWDKVFNGRKGNQRIIPIESIRKDYAIRTLRKEDVLLPRNNMGAIGCAIAIFAAFFVLEFSVSKASFLAGTIFSVLCGVILYIRRAVPNYLFLKRQEEALGIDFNAEMLKREVTYIRYWDEDWFGVSWSKWNFLVHRDYIEAVKRVHYNREDGFDEVTVALTDGTKKFWRSPDVGAFQKWFNKASILPDEHSGLREEK